MIDNFFFKISKSYYFFRELNPQNGKTIIKKLVPSCIDKDVTQRSSATVYSQLQ